MEKWKYGLPKANEEGFYSHIDGPAVIHDPESPPDHQDEYDDTGLFDKSFEYGRKDLPGLRIFLGFLEHQPRFVNAAFSISLLNVFPAGDDPGKDGSCQDDVEYNYVGMGDLS